MGKCCLPPGYFGSFLLKIRIFTLVLGKNGPKMGGSGGPVYAWVSRLGPVWVAAWVPGPDTGVDRRHRPQFPKISGGDVRWLPPGVVTHRLATFLPHGQKP